jgi:hypothetical protein
MTNDKSLELPDKSKSESISSDAIDWGDEFVKRIRLEYTDLASELPADAKWLDYQKAMMIAFGRVFNESGASIEETMRLWEEVAGRLSTFDNDAIWSPEKNDRRLLLIDNKIQGTMTPEEAFELMQLTHQMRMYCDREDMVPLEGARAIHRRLLDMDPSKGTSS